MRLILVIVGLLGFKSIFAQVDSITSVQPLTIGEQVYFDSEILGESRQLNIYLPLNYSKDSLHKYPVIYLLDGTMNEDFIHIAGLVQFGAFSWINMLPESIVVGIANVDRKRDFTFPTTNRKDKKEFPTTGGSAQFIDFIEKELQPLIEKRYRTDTVKTLIGQSLGGLLATEILFKQPDLFDNYIIISPSLWWDDESLLDFKPQPYTTQKKIYIGVGKEGKVMEQVARSLFGKLSIQPQAHTEVFFNYFEAQDHGDVLHLAAYDAFENIFGTKKTKKK